jgi:hypothetical protein
MHVFEEWGLLFDETYGGGQDPHRVVAPVKKTDNNKRSACYNVLTVLFVISISGLAKIVMLRK